MFTKFEWERFNKSSLWRSTAPLPSPLPSRRFSSDRDLHKKRKTQFLEFPPLQGAPLQSAWIYRSFHTALSTQHLRINRRLHNIARQIPPD